MSDSFNSPNHLSVGESEVSSPEHRDPSSHAPSVTSASTAAVADLDEQAAVMESLDEGSSLSEEPTSLEAESFDAIADSIEAEATGAEAATESSEDDVTQDQESFDASVEVVDVEILESQEQEQSYEVHQDGTLTYFQYFLDDEAEAFGPGGEWRDEVSSSPRSFVSATAVGVGVLAATFGAGLLMAEATNRNSISEDDSFEAETVADAERKASEASELAKTSHPESAMPDWSSTQKALAVSQGKTSANPVLGKASTNSVQAKTPATSSVTSKLAPLAQAWGTSMPLPAAPVLPPSSLASAPITTASLPNSIASLPTLPTSSLPTPITTTSLPTPAAVQPLPTYQVVQPSQTIGSSSAAFNSLSTNVSRNEQEAQQLQARMADLRDRMADPIDQASVPVTSDGSDSLLDGPDNRWVGNVPTQVNVPISRGETTIGNVFEPSSPGSLTDSPYTSPSVANLPNSMSSGDVSAVTSSPTPVAAATQTSPVAAPLVLEPIVIPPQQATSLNEAVVPPVAGLVPTPTTALPAEQPSGDVSPQAAVPTEEAAAPINQVSRVLPEGQPAAMEVTPGAIALDVIPPSVSQPMLTAPQATDASIDSANGAEPQKSAMTENTEVQPEQPVVSEATSDAESQALELSLLPPGIQSLEELTNNQSTRPLALSRDTARAALENAEDLEQFKVLPLSVREYQRLWRDNGNEGTFAPVHGFVDYGQNVIAVVVPRGEANPAALDPQGDSSVSTEAAALVESVLTEVSTQQAAPAMVLSQS